MGSCWPHSLSPDAVIDGKGQRLGMADDRNQAHAGLVVAQSTPPGSKYAVQAPPWVKLGPAIPVDAKSAMAMPQARRFTPGGYSCWTSQLASP